MITDILSKLPGLSKSEAEEAEVALSEEDIKAERIAFHRNKVRNGPTKFSYQTSGQVRREQVRALARKTKSARRRQIKGHFATLREIAVLRSRLQTLSIIQYATAYQPGAGDIVEAASWVIRHFADKGIADEQGRVTVTEDVVRQSVQGALNRYQHLTNRPQTALNPSYELPVAVSA